MAGRVEAYIHSDSITPNKGGALVTVSCETDFAAKTPVFAEFCKLVAKMAYGLQKANPVELLEEMPDLEVKLFELSGKLKERISVGPITIQSLPSKSVFEMTH